MDTRILKSFQFLLGISIAGFSFAVGKVTIVTGSIEFHTFVGTFLITTILAGPLALLGGITGYAAHVTALNAWSTIALIDGLSYLVMGYTGYALRQKAELSPFEKQTASQLITEYTMIAFAATTIGVVIMSIGVKFIHLINLFPTNIFILVNWLLSVFLIGWPVILGIHVFSPEDTGTPGSRSAEVNNSYGRRKPVAFLLVLPVLWIIVSSLVDMAYQTATFVPSDFYVMLKVDWLLPLRNPAYVGRGAAAVQVAIGVGFLIYWGHLLGSHIE